MVEGHFPRAISWALFSISLLIRLLVLAVNLRHPHPVLLEPDSIDYVMGADALSHGRVLSDLRGSPSMLRPPGYSGWLALLFLLRIASPTSPVGAILFQIVLSALCVVLASRLAFDLGGVRVAVLTGLVLSIEPSCIAFSQVLMSETLYTLGLLGSLMLWKNWWLRPRALSLALMVLLIGLLPLVRPVGVYLPFLFAILIWTVGPASERRLRVALFFLGLALVPTCAWRARNYYRLGTTELSSIGPWNAALFAHSVETMAQEATPPSGPWDRDFAERGGRTSASALLVQNEFFRTTMARHPLLGIKRAALNAMLMAGVPDDLLVRLCLENPPPFMTGSIGARLSWMRHLGLISCVLLTGMVVSVGGISLLLVHGIRSPHLPPLKRGLLVCVICVILYHLAVSALVQYQADRFRAPIAPLLAISLVLGALGRRTTGNAEGADRSASSA